MRGPKFDSVPDPSPETRRTFRVVDAEGGWEVFVKVGGEEVLVGTGGRGGRRWKGEATQESVPLDLFRRAGQG